MEGKLYWCTVCSAVHRKVEGSEEYVTRTGWVIVDAEGKLNPSGEKINIGFCNGVHSEGRPKHYMPAGIMPEFVPVPSK